MTKTQNLPIAQIRRDSGAQFREKINEPHIARIMDAIEGGDKIPAIEVFFDGALYWLADGFHRIEAFARIGHKKIAAEIHDGSELDARRRGRSANAEHNALPRSVKAKRAAVTDALTNDPEWAKWSNYAIAKGCGVSEGFVRQMKNDLGLTTHIRSEETTYTDKHGNISQMKTGNIGRHLDASEAPEIELTPEQIEDAKLKYSVIDGALKIGLFLRCVECGPEINPDAPTLGEYLQQHLPMLSEDAARQFMDVAAYRHPDVDKSATDWPDNSDEAFRGDWAELLRLSSQAWKATEVKEVWPRFKAIMADQMAYAETA